MILLIDNYDSFSYNLYQLIGSLNPDIRWFETTGMHMAEIEKRKPAAVVISPALVGRKPRDLCGSGSEAGGSILPILGVCLGHQAICQAYGTTVSLPGADAWKAVP